MAASSWTPGSQFHTNDGTNEADVPFINNDNYGSTYRKYSTDGSWVELLVRHQNLAPQSGLVLTDRHNLTWTYQLPGEEIGDPTFKQSISLSMNTPRFGTVAGGSQALLLMANMLSISAVREQLLTWRV